MEPDESVAYDSVWDPVATASRMRFALLAFVAFLVGLAALALLWFAGRLAGLFRGLAGAGERIPTITIAGNDASTALFLAGSGAFAALATAAVFLEAAAVGILRTALLPRWVGLAGAVLVTLLLVNGAVRLFARGDGSATLASVTDLLLLARVLVASAMLSSRELGGHPRMT